MSDVDNQNYFTIFLARRFRIWQCIKEATNEATSNTPKIRILESFDGIYDILIF